MLLDWETRRRMWMQAHRVGRIPNWVRLAFAGQLRPR